jgi:spoIIIJ-associated protein
MTMADQHAKVSEFVRQVVGAMGLSLDVKVEVEDDNVRLNLEGAGGDVLLRRKGEALDALQHVVNTAFRRDAGERHYTVDCLGYRRGRDAELREMTRFMMEKAKASGASQEIGPLNPYARRLVHLTVAQDPGCTSESIGDAFLKTVIISAKR